ncbi:MAG: hypothetical protein U0235_21045 [Polyangiaceae bacterium]
MQAFQSIVGAIDEGVEGVEDEARMRDPRSCRWPARTTRPRSLSDENNQPKPDETKISAAAKYWNKVDVGSYTGSTRSSKKPGPTSWPATTRARSGTSTPSRRRTSRTHYPEAQILRGRVIYFFIVITTTPARFAANFQAKYQPIYDDLNKVLGRFKGDNQEEAFFKFLKQVQDGKADLKSNIAPIVKNALSDRQFSARPST